MGGGHRHYGVHRGGSPRKGQGAPGVIQHREGEQKPSAFGGGGEEGWGTPIRVRDDPNEQGSGPSRAGFRDGGEGGRDVVGDLTCLWTPVPQPPRGKVFRCFRGFWGQGGGFLLNPSHLPAEEEDVRGRSCAAGRGRGRGGAAGTPGCLWGAGSGVWGAAAIPYVELSLLVWWRCVQRGNIMGVLGVKM